MTGVAVRVALTGQAPVDWVRDSLRQGGPIARHAIKVLESKAGRVFAIAPDQPRRRVPAFGEGGVIRSALANAALAKELDALKNPHAGILYIEDNLRRPGDRALGDQFSHYRVIQGSVVHWHRRSPSNGAEAVKLIRAASNGYPLSAFLGSTLPDTGDAEEPNTDLLAAAIASTTVAIVVSAFDSESFLIWEAIEPRC